MDAPVLLKIFASLAVIVLIWLDFRPKKRKDNTDPDIASANASERHDWRYARWGIQAVRPLSAMSVKDCHQIHTGVIALI